MPLWKRYHIAQDISDAVTAYEQVEGPRRYIAGGTDLLLDMQQGRLPGIHTLIDVSNIAELRKIELRGDHLFIGAGLPLNEIIASPLVWQHAQALGEACALIGGPQVRNTATLGGNVAHALPAADGTIALLALDARAEVAGSQGCRQVALPELFLGPGRSALLEHGELLVGFSVPIHGEHTASAFRRVMRPQGVAIAILNLAVWLERREDQVAGIRIAVGPAGPVPLRAVAAEAALRGKDVNANALAQAGAALLKEGQFRTSPHRATSGYRRHVAQVLLEETFTAAWQRAAPFTTTQLLGSPSPSPLSPG